MVLSHLSASVSLLPTSMHQESSSEFPEYPVARTRRLSAQKLLVISGGFLDLGFLLSHSFLLQLKSYEIELR